MENSSSPFLGLYRFARDIQQTFCGQNFTIFLCKEIGFLFREKVIVILPYELMTAIPQQRFAGLVESDEPQIPRFLDEHHVGDMLQHRHEERLGPFELQSSSLSRRDIDLDSSHSQRLPL